PAYLYRAGTKKIEKLRSNSRFLGMFESADFLSEPLHLETGDILLVYSDGLPDAQNLQEEMYGERRLLDLVRRDAASGSQVLEQRLLESIVEFTQGTPQTDDITFVIVEKNR